MPCCQERLRCLAHRIVNGTLGKRGIVNGTLGERGIVNGTLGERGIVNGTLGKRGIVNVTLSKQDGPAADNSLAGKPFHRARRRWSAPTGGSVSMSVATSDQLLDRPLDRPLDQPSSRPTAPAPAPAPAAVSVVITVWNDPDGLEEALDSLARQTRPPDEIVVADGGSDAEPLAAIRRLAGRYTAVRLLVGKRCNIAEGRNRAIRDARGSTIACTDAGCRPHPAWLERLTRPLTDPDVEVVGGGYRVTPRGELQRMAALLAMRSTADADPRRFNPSARSIAFRREAWERAGGFPTWLDTAEDTLLCLKLRSLSPPPVYTFVPDAFVTWAPRPTLGQTLKQFYRYARGEGQIGRGAANARYQAMRWAAALVWLATAVVLFGRGAAAASAACAVIAAWAMVRPFSLKAGTIVDRMGAGALPIAWAMSELLTLVQWIGWRRGVRDRRRRPELYVERLRRYFGRDHVDDAIAEWNCAPTDRTRAPRTLVVAWHWPPAARASAHVMETLFRAAPPDVFHVLTRRPAGAAPVLPWEGAAPVERIRWPLATDEPVRLWTWLAGVVTTCRFVLRAAAVHRRCRFERVLAVYPTRYGVLAGWLISKAVGAPLVLYMHDLFAEGLLTGSRIKRRFWTGVDRRIVAGASLVITPTDELAEHYRRRGVGRTWVLPHCVPDDVCDWTSGGGDDRPFGQRAVDADAADAAESAVPAEHDDVLRLVYAGKVYDAHADAAAALAAVGRDAPDVELTFLSNPHPVLAGCDVRWVGRRAALEEMRRADVCVAALAFDSPWPAEVRGCFPSKLTEYLALGKPILAVAPPGCFVDRFLRTHRCGEVVNSLDPAAIRAAIETLRDGGRRAELSTAARAAARTLRAPTWMAGLLEELSRPIPPATAVSRSF
ncbi:MAG: glycosyltransferase [Phycisphaerales bacterium]|nr:MAG: glycosyltransferase [Phycisphaerales bacterium]